VPSSRTALRLYIMSLPEDLNLVDLFPSLGESAETPNKLGLTDTAILNHWINRTSFCCVWNTDSVQSPEAQ